MPHVVRRQELGAFIGNLGAASSNVVNVVA